MTLEQKENLLKTTLNICGITEKENKDYVLGFINGLAYSQKITQSKTC